jgi:hypothetical protein
MTQAPTDTTRLVDGPTDAEVDAAVRSLGDDKGAVEIGSVFVGQDGKVVFEEVIADRTPSAASLLINVAGAPAAIDPEFEEIILEEELVAVGLDEQAYEEIDHTLSFDPIFEFEAVLKLFDEQTLVGAIAEEVLGINDIQPNVKNVDAYTALLLERLKRGASEDEVREVVESLNPLNSYEAVDVEFAAIRLNLLEHTMTNLYHAHQEGRVSDEYFAKAEEESKKLFELYGHEAEYEHEGTGANVVVVDFSNRPEPQI